MKKIFLRVIPALMIVFVVCANMYVFAADTVTMYAKDGRTKEVAADMVEANKKVGWYTSKPITVYALDGRTKTIGEKDIEAYKKVGWYAEPSAKIYAPDGRSKVVAKKDVAANEKVGWYSYPVTKMYSKDGRTKVVAKSNIAAYQKVGWYTEPFIKVYDVKGNTKTIQKKDLSAYQKVGWYSSVDEAQKAARYKDPKYDHVRKALSKIRRYASYLYFEGSTLEISVDLYRMTGKVKYLSDIVTDVTDISNYFSKIKKECANIRELYPIYSYVNCETPIITSSRTAAAKTYATKAKTIKTLYNSSCDFYGGQKIE